MSKRSIAALSAVLVVLAAIAYPVGGAIAAIMKTKVVNQVKVEESGAKVFKIFDQDVSSGSRVGASKKLEGYKTVRVVVYQTTDGSSSGGAIANNYSCGGGLTGKFGVDVEFGDGVEGGVTAGNNTLEVDEPSNMTNRTHIYAGEFAMLRPRVGLDMCNHTSEEVHVTAYLYAFKN